MRPLPVVFLACLLGNASSAISQTAGTLSLVPPSLTTFDGRAEFGQLEVAQSHLQTEDEGVQKGEETGLAHIPEPPATQLTKADVVQQQAGIYEARNVLEESAAGSQDPVVLTRLAAAQEAYGDRAEAAYTALANATAKGSPERFHALDRGFNLSLRDGELKQAATFADLLDADGHGEYRTLLGGKRAVAADSLVPGGLEAFGVIAHVKPGTPPERFFAEYARALIANVACVNNCVGDRYTNAVQSYFATVAELEGLGKRDGDRVTILLSLNGKEENKRTENVLKLLGMQMHNEKGKVRLDRGEKESQGKKQDILSALQIDEIGMSDALGAGRTFSFEIRDDYAAIYPSAAMWKGSFPKLEQTQFALMLLHKPDMARLYAGVSSLDRSTVQALIGNSGLFWFTGRPAELLSIYGSSFAVEGTHASVPGGAAAEPVWSQLVGAPTDHPGAFYQALLNQKSPSLLAYFYALSNLDREHQAFFTANPARAKRFYSYFATLPESQTLPNSPRQDSSFSELLRSVPIDGDGHVVFPGSPQVWEVAKGNAYDDRHVAKMMKKVSRAATPEIEDDVLLRLVATRNKVHSAASSELDNFLSIAGIDAHRADPLDEESALMLAQHYSDFSAAYPYFTDLTAIDAAGFRSFFGLVDGMARQPVLERQLEMGQVNSLIEWIVLIKRRGAINDAQAAGLFTKICERLAAANDEGIRARTSVDLAKTILGECGHDKTGQWDDTLRSCLLGESAGKTEWRGKDYEVVLDEQKAPSLEGVDLIVSAAETALDPAGGSHPAMIPSDKALFPPVLPSKAVKVSGKEREAILLYDPARIESLIEKWNQNAKHSPQSPGETNKLALELLRTIEPQVTLALAAPVYAYFFRSTDRIVMDDPLLMRKHRYFDFINENGHGLMQESRFIATSDGLGSHMEGGFSEFGLAAGLAAAAGWKQGGSGGPDVVAEQIAAIRSATWSQLLEADQRLVTLRILAAREWIVAAAQDSKLFVSLSEETSGLLSLSRRADLLSGIREREWQQVWGAITLPDLFRLGGFYLQRYPNAASPSPVVAQLRLIMAANDGARLNILGRIPTHVLGCGHTHLVSDAPYEEYERQMLPVYMAERTAEFKLFLAYRADSLGVRPTDLSQAAERLAAKAFSSSQMSDYRDWRSLLAAYGSVTDDNLKTALEQE